MVDRGLLTSDLLESKIVEVLPVLAEERVQIVSEMIFSKTLGENQTTWSDLALLQEKDLEAVLPVIPLRKLLDAFKVEGKAIHSR